MNTGSLSIQESATFILGDAATVAPLPFQGLFTKDLSSAVGTQAIVGVGFNPTWVSIWFQVPATPTAAWFMGCSSGASDSIAIYDRNLQAANTYSNSTQITLYRGVSILYEGRMSSYDSDGFTWDWHSKTGAPTGTVNCRFLAYK